MVKAIEMINISKGNWPFGSTVKYAYIEGAKGKNPTVRKEKNVTTPLLDAGLNMNSL